MPRELDMVDAEFIAVVRQALARGAHVLAHVLMSSKTGLSAPSHQVLEALASDALDRVDVVVDACQVRAPLDQLGELVRKGWMVQISGSKFLTGPPFSGALVVPSSFRERASALADVLGPTTGVCHPTDWTGPWSEVLGRTTSPSAGFGPVFRWLPALMEAQLFALLAEGHRRALFRRFRRELLDVIGRSRFLKPLSTDRVGTSEADHFLSLSILSFQIYARRADGSLSVMDGEECERLFVCLNTDMSDRLPVIRPGQRGLAKLQVHIGQPVIITTDAGPICVLRFVLGARFFTFVGHCEAESSEAALQSEIADARRALEKLELLAENWPTIVMA
jgi:hypothetical protein